MAKREGQGLQIAVIIFAMLTIILAITTYVFFAQSQTTQKTLDGKTKQMADLQGQVGKLNARLTVMKAALGVGDVTAADVDLAKGQAGDDAEVKQVLDQLTQDMAVIGDQAPEGTKSYRTMLTVLMNSLKAKNASLADLNQQMRRTGGEGEGRQGRNRPGASRGRFLGQGGERLQRSDRRVYIGPRADG